MSGPKPFMKTFLAPLTSKNDDNDFEKMQECAKMAPCWASSPNIKCNYINTNPNSTAPILQQLTHEAINHLELLSILGDVENSGTLYINTFTLSTCICICSVGKPFVSQKFSVQNLAGSWGLFNHTHQKKLRLRTCQETKTTVSNNPLFQVSLSALFVLIKGSGRSHSGKHPPRVIPSPGN